MRLLVHYHLAYTKHEGVKHSKKKDAIKLAILFYKTVTQAIIDKTSSEIAQIGEQLRKNYEVIPGFLFPSSAR